MIYFRIPYAFDKKLVNAIDREMNLLPGLHDWAFFTDGDTAFLMADFGHQIEHYIKKYPKTGMFTCYASRCHYACQVPKNTDVQSDSITYHKERAEYIYKSQHGKTKQINRRIAGHLFGMKKQTWLTIREEVFKTARNKEILGVDTKISNAIIKHGFDIKLMRGVYLFHYMRLKEGAGYTKHLTK